MLLRHLNILTLIAVANSIYASDESAPQQASSDRSVTIEVISKHQRPEPYRINPFEIRFPLNENDTNQILLTKLKDTFHNDTVMLFVDNNNCDLHQKISDAKTRDAKELLISINFNYPKIIEQLRNRELTGKKVNGLRGFPHDYTKYVKHMQEKNKQ